MTSWDTQCLGSASPASSPRILAARISCFSPMSSGKPTRSSEISQGTLSLEVEEGQEDDYYLRKPVQSDGGLAWEDAESIWTWMKNSPRSRQIEARRTRHAQELLLGTRQLRMDLIVSDSRDDSEEIPATFLFVVSDFESNDILAARIEEPGQKLVKFRDSLLTTFSDVVVRLGERPSTVHVELYSLCDIMGDTLAKTEIKLSHHSLPPIRESEMEAINRRLEHRSEQEIVGASTDLAEKLFAGR